MSVDFSNVQVGDRIKLTRANGDEFTFTVKGDPWGKEVVRSESGPVHYDDWDTLETLEKALPEVPTRMGAMIHNGSKGFTYLVRNSSGWWLNDSGERLQEKEVRKAMRDGWKVVFEGIDYDA